jgi:hypothetical protein
MRSVLGEPAWLFTPGLFRRESHKTVKIGVQTGGKRKESALPVKVEYLSLIMF